ncbi:hypothetical protein GLOTRDRAFT_132956 [Gloeophyllum trabeum ATCC 11539]|uniref:Uncharacterized protein n=1 Tax=Gloeophyllum trabeum (strain ATCC 11539 / FP-39264 / Madison 617) TaxID=670483 RepID=S7PVQ3_GLOTA|nr:uncharacterized protein GLOTRDRAFT_132956 [Gloeophyllum trabeum ATCC 11539]EPQ51588.1 hypothetical protein GLOTRDRAFT_132956 [Gloeophyllum trabeum ATCC 11539]
MVLEDLDPLPWHIHRYKFADQPLQAVSKEKEIERIARYRRQLHAFASLALTSRAFRQAVNHYLYRTLVIFPSTDVAALSPSLEKYGHVVRTIVHDATVGDMPWHASIDERPRLIGRCFCLILHANDLKVIGHHILFMPRHSRTYGLTQHASFPRNTVLAPPFNFGPDGDLDMAVPAGMHETSS